jgi:CheY-like chemotaxis protein
MKILVIDDNGQHLAAAIRQLGSEHELHTAQSYKAGQYKLGFSYTYGQTTGTHSFDVVLCDLLMPAPSEMSRRSGMGGQEMPVGMFLATLAAINGAKYVGLLTDTNHHDHPASECLDAFHGDHGPRIFNIAGAQVVLVNDSFVSEYEDSDLSTPVDHEEFYRRSEAGNPMKTIRAKNWSALLQFLLNGGWKK